jgi:hypothetical protein
MPNGMKDHLLFKFGAGTLALEQKALVFSSVVLQYLLWKYCL